MKKNLLTNSLLLISLATPAAADPLPKEIENMSCLLGSWKGSGTLVMGRDKANLEGTWTCKRTSGDHAVLCNLRITGIPGVAVYEETDLFGYEPNSKTYHWFAVTNGGETHDHVAPYTQANKIRFAYNGTQNGKPFKELVDWEFLGDKTGKAITGINVRGETFEANKSTSVIELKMKKQ